MKQREITNKNFKKGIIFTKGATSQEDLANYIIRGVFSTVDEDRHGEVVDQRGWNVKEYLLNPVVLFNHDHSIPAVAKMIDLYDGPNGLEGAMQFAADVSPFAKELFGLYAGSFMNAFSCGFLNDVYEYDQQNDKIILRENTLLEVSCVNVPANAYALAKSIGMNVEAIGKAIEKGCPCENQDESQKVGAESTEKECGDDCDCDECGKIESVSEEITTDSPGDEVVDSELDEAKESVKSLLQNMTKADARKSITKRDAILMINKGIGELLKVKKTLRR
jgi:HK97 family phage prohead protease